MARVAVTRRFFTLFDIEAKKTTITGLELNFFLPAISLPLAITTSLPTLFLVDDMEEVAAENILSLWPTTRLLIHPSHITQLIILLHRVRYFALTLWDHYATVELFGVRRVTLDRIVEAYLVYTVVLLASAINVAENEPSKHCITLGVACLMLPQ